MSVAHVPLVFFYLDTSSVLTSDFEQAIVRVLLLSGTAGWLKFDLFNVSCTCTLKLSYSRMLLQ